MKLVYLPILIVSAVLLSSDQRVRNPPLNIARPLNSINMK
jgi:hypothetical protein